MWVSALVAFLAISLQNWFGFDVPPEVQAGIAGILTGFFTWLVPNATA